MTLFVLPKQVPIQSAGNPHASAKLYFYRQGTTTDQTVYNDADLAPGHEHAQPVQADSSGVFPPIYLDDTADFDYRIQLKTSAGVLIYDVDDYPKSGASGVTILSTQLKYAQTAAESAALVTPTNTQYEPDDLRRLNVIGDGSTDDSAAFANVALVAAQGQKFKGQAGATYKIASVVTLGSYFDLDLNGATLKPSGNTLLFSSAVSPDVTTSYSGAIAVGARTFTVTSAAGMSAGMWVYFYVDLSTEPDYSYPPSWAKITNVSGTTITVDRAFRCDYPASPTDGTVYAFSDATLKSKCHIYNGTIDGSASTYAGATLGYAMRIVGYKDVLLRDLYMTGFNTTSTNGDLIVPYQSLSVVVDNVKAVGNTTGSQAVNIVDTRDSRITNCEVDGSGFGLAILRCDSARMTGNTCVGRRKQEHDDAVTQRSTRGIKAYACKFVRIKDNHLSDYESPLKVEACHRYVVTGNEVVNASLTGTYDGTIALNVSNQTNGTITQQGIVANNVVENCNGIGIGVTNSTSYGKHIVTGNQVRNCQGIGIYAPTKNAIITSNQIYNWGLRNSSDVGIYHDSGATILGNRFYQDTLTSLGCIRSTFTASHVYTIRDNSSPTNPIFAGSLDVISSGGTTIASGATSSTPTHNLILTPNYYEIIITPANSPTNDPGHWWVSSITSTQFTINVRSDPGAGGAIFYWRAELKQPFTAP